MYKFRWLDKITNEKVIRRISSLKILKAHTVKQTFRYGEVLKYRSRQPILFFFLMQSNAKSAPGKWGPYDSQKIPALRKRKRKGVFLPPGSEGLKVISHGKDVSSPIFPLGYAGCFLEIPYETSFAIFRHPPDMLLGTKNYIFNITEIMKIFAHISESRILI